MKDYTGITGQVYEITVTLWTPQIALLYPSDCTTTRDHLKMASNTESELEDEVEETEEAGPDVMIVESVNAKGKSKESAVWLYFEKTEERSGSQSQAQRVANCKECGKSIKVVKGNTSNLMSLTKHKLLSDCPTRWNSTYYMLTRLLEQKPAITVMCASSVGPRVSLSASEWCMMSELFQILQPLEEATQELSTEQRVSCSKVIPLLNALLFELCKNVLDNDET